MKVATRGARTLAVAAVLAALASVSRAAAVDASTGTVSGSTTTAVSPSTATAPSPAPKPDSKPSDADKTPAPPSSADLSARAVASLRGLASAYSDKRRTPFMKFVSDDYTGDLGTLEDALSSDFRSYRTIVLAVTPNQTTVKALMTQVQFRFDMTVTDDQGKTTKFAGQAVYTFVDENGRSKLYRMDRTPIFGTSLSSVENPVAKSQGAPTSTAAGGNTAPNSCGATVTGSASINSETGQSFNFGTQSTGSSGSGDIEAIGSNFSTNGGSAISDLGSCDINSFTQDPATISDSSDPVNVGDCYAIRTGAGKYGVFSVTSSNAGVVTFQYKYQPSGQRCF